MDEPTFKPGDTIQIIATVLHRTTRLAGGWQLQIAPHLCVQPLDAPVPETLNLMYIDERLALPRYADPEMQRALALLLKILDEVNTWGMVTGPTIQAIWEVFEERKAPHGK